MNRLQVGTLAFVMSLGLAACSSEDKEGMDVEQAAENAGDIMEDAGDAAENAADEVGDAAEEAGDSMEEGYNDMTQ